MDIYLWWKKQTSKDILFLQTYQGNFLNADIGQHYDSLDKNKKW